MEQTSEPMANLFANKAPQKTLADTSEFELIKNFSSQFTPPETVTGIGDDCAVIPMGKERCQLITTDFLVEGVHFLKESMSPWDLGYKSMAVNLSDIAAMGGVARFALLSLVLPKDLPVNWVEKFIKGFGILCDERNISLVGGDTTQGEKITISITLLGEGASENIKMRSGAKVGDVVCLSGTVGDSYLGLKCLLEKKNVPHGDYLIGRHCRPRPHLEEGYWLAKQPGIRSMMDVSDGLVSDLKRIGEASCCGFRVDMDSLPVSFEATKVASALSIDPFEAGAVGGEDYCLLLTVDPEKYVEVSRRFEHQFDKPLSKVGLVVEGTEVCLLRNNEPVSLSLKPFAHF